MKKIAPNLVDALARNPEASIPVLICCDQACSSIKTKLEAAGIQVTGSISEIETLSAEICSSDLELLSSMPGIESIELDEIGSTQ